MNRAITIRHLNTEAEQEGALDFMLSACGWRRVEVGCEKHLVPTDPLHPGFPKAVKKLVKAMVAEWLAQRHPRQSTGAVSARQRTVETASQTSIKGQET